MMPYSIVRNQYNFNNRKWVGTFAEGIEEFILILSSAFMFLVEDTY